MLLERRSIPQLEQLLNERLNLRRRTRNLPVPEEIRAQEALLASLCILPRETP